MDGLVAGPGWQTALLLTAWGCVVTQEGRWQAQVPGCWYRAVAVEPTAFWQPRLPGCATVPVDSWAGNTRPANPVVAGFRHTLDVPGEGGRT